MRELRGSLFFVGRAFFWSAPSFFSERRRSSVSFRRGARLFIAAAPFHSCACRAALYHRYPLSARRLFILALAALPVCAFLAKKVRARAAQYAAGAHMRGGAIKTYAGGMIRAVGARAASPACAVPPAGGGHKPCLWRKEQNIPFQFFTGRAKYGTIFLERNVCAACGAGV